jgi:adenylyltransferase/sulfurtransferase
LNLDAEFANIALAVSFAKNKHRIALSIITTHQHFTDAMLPTLSNDELKRYSRHLLLDEIGLHGQQRLKSARVLVVGAGGLGSPALLYLAAAGVGTLGVVDFDTVEESNLQRQILHSSESVGQSKLTSAFNRLTALNPQITIRCHAEQLVAETAIGILSEYDVIIDGTDNFATRYILNDACILLGKPLVYGAIHRFEGQVAVFAPHCCTSSPVSSSLSTDLSTDGVCYRCLFPEPPPPEFAPNCAELGVLGVLPGVIGTLQATEALKLLLDIGEPLSGRMLVFDALSMKFSELTLKKHTACRAQSGCSLVQNVEHVGITCWAEPTISKADTPNTPDATVEREIPPELTWEALIQKITETSVRVLLLDVREEWEYRLRSVPSSVFLPFRALQEIIDQQGLQAHSLLSFLLSLRQQQSESVELSAIASTAPDTVNTNVSLMIAVFCASGKRSARARDMLRAAGLLQTAHISGGINTLSKEQEALFRAV